MAKKKAEKAAENTVQFYDVKTRKKVDLPSEKVMKKKFVTSNGQERFGLRGETEDGRKLTKFISKADWESSSYKEEV
jgi:hypothetical protein